MDDILPLSVWDVEVLEELALVGILAIVCVA